jgi:hypothetical protein
MAMIDHVKTIVTSALAIGLALFCTPSWALSRYECKGITKDTIVLTPYEDNTVTLAFNKGAPEEKTVFMHKGDVLTAEFQNVSGQQGASLTFILDTITNNGYELAHIPQKPAFATKIMCFWFAN